MKNWTYQIIEELRENYSEVPSDLTRFAKQTLLVPPTDLASITNFTRVLNDLESEGYITWKACIVTKDENGKEIYGEFDEVPIGFSEQSFIKQAIGKHNSGEDRTLENNRIEGRLTIKGVDYSIKIKREDELHSSQIDTNNSFKTANKWMPWLTFALVIVSLSPIALEMFKENKSHTFQQKISKQLLSLDNTQKKNQLLVDSLLRANSKKKDMKN